MPLSKIALRPGVNKEATTYSNEGGWWETNWVRFRSGYPEKIGGWIRNGTLTFYGVVRYLWNWLDLDGNDLLGVGTNQKLYVEQGGEYHDITPLRASGTINTDPITTFVGEKRVQITDTAHGAQAGDFVTFSGASAVGGLTISGEYEIVYYIDADNYYIASPTAASSSANGGGAAVTAAYKISGGGGIFIGGVGWGAGSFGGGGWGSASSPVPVGTQLRLWNLDNFGQDLIAAVRNGPVYHWANDTSTWAAAQLLSTVSTAAGYAGTFVPHTVLEMKTSDLQRFAIAIGANSYDPTDANTAFDPMLVRWSDQENEYDWVPTDTNQAGEQRMSHGSTLVTSLTTRQEILVWSDSAVYSMQYLGPPYVWGFTVLLDNISIISPNAKASAATVVYWMGNDKFYTYSGRVETLPCTLRTYVFDRLNKEQAYQVVAGTNEGFSEVWWFYPSTGSTVNDSYVIYNYLDRVWYHGSVGRSFWLDSAVRPLPMGAISVQNSYVSVSAGASDTAIQLFDTSTLPASGVVTIESEDIAYSSVSAGLLQGCTRGYNSTTAAAHLAYTPVTYKTPNQVAFHEYECDDQSGTDAVAIESYVESSDFDIGDGHNFGFVWRLLPDMTFTGSTADSPSATITLEPRRNSGADYGLYSSPTVTRTATYPVEQYTGQVNVRIRGRQMKLRVANSTLGTMWQVGTPRIDIRQSGRK